MCTPGDRREAADLLPLCRILYPGFSSNREEILVEGLDPGYSTSAATRQVTQVPRAQRRILHMQLLGQVNIFPFQRPHFGGGSIDELHGDPKSVHSPCGLIHVHEFLEDFRRSEQPQMGVGSFGKEILGRVL